MFVFSSGVPGKYRKPTLKHNPLATRMKGITSVLQGIPTTSVGMPAYGVREVIAIT